MRSEEPVALADYFDYDRLSADLDAFDPAVSGAHPFRGRGVERF
jgi:hypothetical protein